jgi:hypothetical protein
MNTSRRSIVAEAAPDGLDAGDATFCPQPSYEASDGPKARGHAGVPLWNPRRLLSVHAPKAAFSLLLLTMACRSPEPAAARAQPVEVSTAPSSSAPAPGGSAKGHPVSAPLASVAPSSSPS